ncbi:adenylate/guanylate cyclase domain-containing protein [Bradyrhizobium sp. DOA9]|uniref:adenylate/guanylate cyclase domain-containing protein n=1 Tax=Bradyrhizobium sp. DOA9 TaxID=1126627 RepID=UPI00178CD983|nr:adenylate/guanylate cyclase domain-containing protein [Bradyrhizobium sp. DOA9]
MLAADVAGYSRLMGVDEIGTLTALKSLRREVIDPAIGEYRGRLVKTTGDGMLVEFPSAVDAVTCAMVVQDKIAAVSGSTDPKIAFRIGINVGDIIVDDDDIFGDGVNVAARLENECEPGKVFVSGQVHDQVRGKTPFEFADLGERTLKNIDRPVRIYAVRSEHSPSSAVRAEPTSTVSAASPNASNPVPFPDKPSIAVLPFTNMSSDPEQEYFADGMTEDLITSLSKIRDLLVIARNSTFTYKGKAVDIKQVGRELDVRYVLEGSVRRAGNRIRITGQLIETATGSHVWADRWDSELEDIFELQDQITARIHNAIGGTLVKTEATRARQSGLANVQAWQLRIQAWDGFHRWDREGCLRGVDLGRRATEIDPTESDGYTVTAGCLYAIASSGWTTTGQQAMSEALALASRAVNLDPGNAVAHTLLGMTLLSFDRHDEAVSHVKRGSELSPGSYSCSLGTAMVLGYCGEPKDSLNWFEVIFRINPRDPRLYAAQQSMCVPLFALDRYEEVVKAAQGVMRQIPNWTEAFTMQAAAYAKLGRLIEAGTAVEHLREIDPEYSVKRALRRHPYRDAADRDKLAGALRQAGIS